MVCVGVGAWGAGVPYISLSLSRWPQDFSLFQYAKVQRVVKDPAFTERVLNETIKLLRTMHTQLNMLPDSTRQQV